MGNKEKNNLRSKRGRFTVSRELLLDTVGFFKPFNIIETRSNAFSDEIEYLAFSPLFDSIPESGKAPEYIIDVTQDRMGNYIWEAERIYNDA